MWLTTLRQTYHRVFARTTLVRFQDQVVGGQRAVKTTKDVFVKNLAAEMRLVKIIQVRKSKALSVWQLFAI